MKIKLLLLLILSLYTVSSFAQHTFTIKGATVDTASKAKLVNMTVCLLNAKDSTLLEFAYTKESGTFNIKELPAGKYILLISYPDYADYAENFDLNIQHATHDFGNINMKSKAILLREVMIKGNVQAIKIKGDTTEFNAKAYVIQPNDKVEDLLRQLPGIQVDQNGKITAQGQTVTKVLLDGEEFFGDDPTLVIKNIRADMVDKVQLYDKKSDQAAFTGIDDGIKTKTINIKLKEDKKNGVFGKVNAGIGTDNYYESQAIYNRFKANEKYSIYATVANDGKTGLTNIDNGKIGSGNVQIGDNGLINTSMGSDALDSYNGNYNGRGYPLTRSGGMHYDNKWSADKQSINTNYQIGSIQVTGINTNTTQQNLPTGLINSNANESFDNYVFRQKMNAAYRLKIDTTSNLKVSADGAIKNFRVNNSYLTTSQMGNDNLINRQARAITNNGDQQLFEVSAFYTKKLKKPRRTFSWEISESYDKNQTKGYLSSETNFYNTLGIKDSTENVNQYKTSQITNSALSSNITYSEPLSKVFTLVVNYGLGINNSTADRKSFNQSAADVYDILDGIYSNNYQFNQLTNQLGAIFTYSSGKKFFNFGTQASGVNFKQVNEYSGDIYKRNFINWAPQAYYEYSFSQQRTLSFFYTGLNTQPTIDQLQPVRTNNDPLNITLGNPNLKPAFTNKFNLTYRLNNVSTNLAMYLEAIYAFTTNDIAYNIATDASSGKTTIQYNNIKVKSSYKYSLFADFGGQFDASGINWGITLNAKGNVSYNYINNILNTANTYSYTSSISLSKSKKNKYSIFASAGPDYSINEFSLQPQSNNNAGGFNATGSGRLFLPLKFQIASDIHYNYTAKTQAFDAEKRMIWNASLSKTLLKGDNLKFSFSANDLLNQNLLFNRSMANNTITQSTSSSIKRYFMFSVSWDFTRFGTIPVKK